MRSDIHAADWIINYRITHDRLPYNTFYATCEKSLDPVWLAIEPSYYAVVLNPHLKHPKDSGELQRFRFSVGKILGQLKRKPSHAALYFRARQRKLPDVLKLAIQHQGLRLDDLEIEDEPVTNPLRLWSRIGEAVQHLECLRLLEGRPSRFKPQRKSRTR